MSVALAVVVLVLIYWSSRVVTRRLLATVLSEWRWAQLVWLLLTVSAGAVLTDRLGLSAVVGAFFAGLGAGDGVGQDSRRCAVGALRPLLWLLVPFFFVMIGVQAQWRALVEPAVMLLLVGLLLVGIAGKAIGGVLGATWVSGFGARWLVGFGMVGRGEVALVVATLGYEQGHISQHAYGALVVAIIGLALFGPLAMARLARRMGAEVTDAPG